MYLLGHAGLTVASVDKLDHPRRVDLRLAGLLALLPDLVDKPIAVFAWDLVNGSTRNFGHSALGALGVLAVLLVFRERVGRPWLLWSCYAGHLLLDLMWTGRSPVVFCWPLLGPFPRPARESFLPEYLTYYLLGEAAGAVALVLTVRRRVFKR